jgi:Ser/Thr protein kinase RdoA (MazF antagonist)
MDDTDAIDAWVAAAVAVHLDSELERVSFRSGRIDAVYGLVLTDGRTAVLKVHRPPVALSELAATNDGLRHLSAHGYPCPEPLAGPVEVDGHTITFQSLLTDGSSGDARQRAIRRAMVTSLAEHIELLAGLPGGSSALAGRLGPGPAWTRYAAGPWPQPHDLAIDLSTTPPGWEWLDDYARNATDDLTRLRGASTTVVAHADWYAGNLRFDHNRVVASFDWHLYAEQEAVIVGLSAGGYLTDDAPTPSEVVAYLDDYENVRPLSGDARRAAEAAARWMLAFNARFDLAGLDGAPSTGSALDRLMEAGDAYTLLDR